MTREEYEADVVRRVMCPYCRMPKLNRCRSAPGEVMKHPHPERIQRAKYFETRGKS